MRPVMLAMARTALCVEDCTAAIWPAISSVALAVCTASDLTSEATTAKPLPAAPARAASIVALSASRLVWPATSWMSLTTSPIFCAACARPAMSALVDCASADRGAHHVGRARELAVDLGDRLRQFLGRVGGDLDAGRSAAFEVCTAPPACCEVSFDAPTAPVAVDFIAADAVGDRLQARLRRSARNQAMASSTAARRASCSSSSALCRSAWRRSVMSWWVPTQYGAAGIGAIDDRDGPAVGQLGDEAERLAGCHESACSSARYCSGSRSRLPVS